MASRIDKYCCVVAVCLYVVIISVLLWVQTQVRARGQAGALLGAGGGGRADGASGLGPQATGGFNVRIPI